MSNWNCPVQDGVSCSLTSQQDLSSRTNWYCSRRWQCYGCTYYGCILLWITWWLNNLVLLLPSTIHTCAHMVNLTMIATIWVHDHGRETKACRYPFSSASIWYQIIIIVLKLAILNLYLACHHNNTELKYLQSCSSKLKHITLSLLTCDSEFDTFRNHVLVTGTSLVSLKWQTAVDSSDRSSLIWSRSLRS